MNCNVCTLDYDQLLDRILIDQVNEVVDVCRGLHQVHQEAFTLTALDPNRLTPAIESNADRCINMTRIFQTKKLKDSTISAFQNYFGVKSLAHFALFSLKDPIQRLELYNLVASDEMTKLIELQKELRSQRPIEPLYSLKRYYQTQKLKKQTAKELDYLDLASNSISNSQKKEFFSRARFRESFEEASDVLNKLAIATFHPDKPILRKVIPSKTFSHCSSGSIGYHSRSSSPSSPKQVKRISKTRIINRSNFDNSLSSHLCVKCKVGVRNMRGGIEYRHCFQCFQNFKKSKSNLRCEYPCNFQCRLKSELEDHLDRNCPFEESFCPWPNCYHSGSLFDIIRHIDLEKKHIFRNFVKPTFVNFREHFAEFEINFPKPANLNVRSHFEPISFDFNNQTFYAILIQKVVERSGYKYNRTRLRNFFWIYTLAVPLVASHYSYQLKIPYIYENVENCIDREARVNSVQKASKAITNERWNKHASAAIAFNGFTLNHNIMTHQRIHFKLKMFLTKSQV